MTSELRRDKDELDDLVREFAMLKSFDGHIYYVGFLMDLTTPIIVPTGPALARPQPQPYSHLDTVTSCTR